MKTIICIIMLAAGMAQAGLLEAYWARSVATGIAVPSGLLAYYQFDGNANDSVSTNNGTAYNSPGYVSGIRSSALSITNDNSQYVGFSNAMHSFIGTTSLTVCAWIKPNANIENNILTRYVTAGQGTYYMAVRANGLVVFFLCNQFANRIRTEANTSVTNGVWNHIAFRWDGAFDKTGLSVYVNSVLQAVSASENAGIFTGFAPTDVSTVIGSRSEPSTYGSCNLDILRIYGRALSTNELMQIYNSEKP